MRVCRKAVYTDNSVDSESLTLLQATKYGVEGMNEDNSEAQ